MFIRHIHIILRTFEGSEISYYGHDSFAGGALDLFTEEGADLGQLVEDGEGDVTA